MSEVKIGALCWNQYTDWPSLLEAGIRADRLGYSSLWTWDHVYPIIGDSHGTNYEGWLTLAAWAQATQHVRIGLMVGVELVADRATKAPFPRSRQVTEKVLAAARERGLLLYSSTGHVDGTDGDLVMFGIPFVVSDEELATAVERTAAAIDAVADSP